MRWQFEHSRANKRQGIGEFDSIEPHADKGDAVAVTFKERYVADIVRPAFTLQYCNGICLLMAMHSS